MNQYELESIAYVRRNGPMWRTSSNAGAPLLLTMHTQNDVEQWSQRWQQWAQIDHPNVVHLHDVIAHNDGRWALVQEEIPGQTLAMHCETYSETLRIHAEEILNDIRQGLNALHQHGLIHTDLTARNIMITPDARAVIIDLIEAHMPTHNTDADLHALEELENLVRTRTHAPQPNAYANTNDPGQRLRIQAQLPDTQLRPQRHSWWPLPRKTATKPQEKGQTTPEKTRQKTPKPTKPTQTKLTHVRPQQTKNSNDNTQSLLSPSRILTTGLVISALLGGWGSIQLWTAHAQSPDLSPQAMQEREEHANPHKRVHVKPHTPHATTPTRIQCPTPNEVEEKLRTILHARDEAYMTQNLDTLDTYLGKELITADATFIRTMSEKDSHVENFHTQLQHLRNITCTDTTLNAQAQFALADYQLCTQEGCHTVKGHSDNGQVLNLTFTRSDFILQNVSTE